MISTRKSLRLAGAGRGATLAVVAVVAVVVGLISGGAIRVDGARAPEMLFDESFDVGAGGELIVKVGDMDVEVGPAGTNAARVRVEVTGSDRDKSREYYEKLNFEARLEGSTLSVSTHDDRRWFNFGQWGGRGVGLKVVVSVPAKFDLDVRTSDGDVNASGVDGRHRLVTSDGDLRIGDLAGSSLEARTSDGDVLCGSLRLETTTLVTSDGDIRIENVDGTKCSVRTSDGDITIDRARTELLKLVTSDGDIRGMVDGAELEARTSDGNVRLHIARSMDVEVSTSDGNVVLEVPGDINADLSLKGERVSMNGGAKFRGDVGSHRIEGALNEGGHKVFARTSDGSVTLKLH